jgi:chemotaxis protein CheZ
LVRRRARFVASRFIFRKMQYAMVNGAFTRSISARRNAALIGHTVELMGRNFWGRGVQRKVFRVEQFIAPGRGSAPARPQPRGTEETSATERLARDLALMQDALTRNKRELEKLIGEGKERKMARAADELRASVDGMDYATQRILKSVEVIDDSAKALAAAQKSDYERGLTQEIQEHVVQVYEACNFQDIVGQRIGNVIGLMTMVEDQVAAMIERCGAIASHHPASAPVKPRQGHGLLNGPKLDGDHGHASQHDIDAMFG